MKKAAQCYQVKSNNDSEFILSNYDSYTEYAGLAVTAGISVKFDTAHGRSGPKVGSTKRIDVYGSRAVSLSSRIFCKSDQKSDTPTGFLRPKHNFFLLTVCSLEQYLQNGSKNKILLP